MENNGGNRRDLTVNLRLVADASNAKTARSIAQEVQKAQREIQSAHGTTTEHLKKLDELVPRTNQQIARGLQAQATGYRRLGTVQSIVQKLRVSMIESGHELAGALGSAAHSMADLTAANEEQAQSSHEFIASMEDSANSVLDIATAASSAYTELKKLQALRSTASTASGVTGGGQLLSGAGGGAASLAALAAPAAFCGTRNGCGFVRQKQGCGSARSFLNCCRSWKRLTTMPPMGLFSVLVDTAATDPPIYQRH